MWTQIQTATTVAAVAAVLAALTLARAAVAEPVETRVFSSAAPRAILREIAPVFERMTGHQLVVEYAFAADLKRRIEAGNPFDVAILPPDMADDLARRDKLVAGSRVDLGRTGLGVAVRRGAPLPDIGTVDAFRRALLTAPMVAYADGGASGVQFHGILARLGIAEAMKGQAAALSDRGRHRGGRARRGGSRRDRGLSYPRCVGGRACWLAAGGIADLHRLHRQCRRSGNTAAGRSNPFELADIAGCDRVVQVARLRAGSR